MSTTTKEAPADSPEYTVSTRHHGAWSHHATRDKACEEARSLSLREDGHVFVSVGGDTVASYKYGNCTYDADGE